MRTWLLGTAASAAVMAATGANAAAAVNVAALALDPLTVIATRSEKPVSLAPATVSVITAEEIEQNLANDIKDLVRYEPGVSVRSSPTRFGAALGTTGRDGNAGFNIRGLEGNRVLIQVDGIRQPDAFTFGAQAVGRGDYGDLDLYKSVEILRGPASALYGSDGVAGAVSFTTKDPADLLRAGKDYAALGRGGYNSADDSWGGNVIAAGRSGRWSGLVSYTRRQGHELETLAANDAANTDRTTANPQDIASNAVLAKAVFDASDRQRFRLTYEHLDRQVETNVLSGIAKPPLASTSVIGLVAKDDTGKDRVSLDYRFTDGTGFIARAAWNAYWQKSATSQFTAEDRFTAADRTRLNTFDNRVFGGGLELTSVLGAGGLQHRFTYGGDVSTTREEGLRDGTVPPAGETFPTRAFPNTDYVLAGLYLQDEIVLWNDRLTLYPALRYDWYSLKPKVDAALPSFTPTDQSDGRLSPKFGAVLKAAEGVSLFVNYAQGFKAPAASDVNNVFVNPIQNYRSIPNPNLKPETSETFEAGVRLKGEMRGVGWTASVTGFSGRYKNFIQQVQLSGSFSPTDPGVFQVINFGSVKISGFEAKGQVQLANGLGGLLAVAQSHGDSTNAGVRAPLDSIDPFKLTAALSYRAQGGKFGGQFAVVHSGGKSADRVAQACAPSCFLTPSFTTLDLTAYWNVTERVRLNVGIFNLTDAKYWWWNDVRGLSSTAVSRDAYTQPARNVSASLTLRL